MTVDLSIGDEIDLEVGPIAHGGFCIARHEGRVVFVRHCLPGEAVRARVTEARDGQRFVRADAIEIQRAAAGRVTPPCRYAAPGLCGGCDFQHASLPLQRDLKTAVVREQFARLAHLDVDVEVQPLPEPIDDGLDVESGPGIESGSGIESGPGIESGLSWRSRVEYAVADGGRAGLRGYRSHEVVPIDRCLIAAPAIQATDVLQRSWPGAQAVDVVAPSVGDPVVVEIPFVEVPGDGDVVPMLTERVVIGGTARDYEVSARGFWQVHPAAARTFVETVLAMLAPRPGERALDLYAGVGLFAAPLAAAVGPGGAVIAVESDGLACVSAEANLADQPGFANSSAIVVRARVDDAFGVARSQPRGRPTRGKRGRHGSAGRARHPLMPPSADIVVLDPPRTGAGREVVAAVAALGPRSIAYVACDPAALARDTAYLLDLGYRLSELRAFDAFPMTHHVECIALLTPHPASLS